MRMKQLIEIEVNLIRALIVHGKPLTSGEPEPIPQARQALLATLADARATAGCDCGSCLSIKLAYPQTDGSYAKVAQASAYQEKQERYTLSAGIAGQSALILLHIVGEQIAELELAPTDDEAVILPCVEDLVF